MRCDDVDLPAVLGRGLTSDVFPWDDGRVLKLFHPGSAPEQAEREFKATRAVHGMGLPVPNAHEMVTVNGRQGIVLDRVEGTSLFHLAQSRPWTMFRYTRLLADLHARVNSCKAPPELPTQRQLIGQRIDSSTLLNDGQKETVRRLLAELPDGESLCHGDFHFENVLMTDRGPVFIDWSGATRGHPAGDVASTCWLFEHAELPEDTPWFIHLILPVHRQLIRRSYLNRYLQFQLATRSEIAEWALVLPSVRSARVAELRARNPNM